MLVSRCSQRGQRRREERADTSEIQHLRHPDRPHQHPLGLIEMQSLRPSPDPLYETVCIFIAFPRASASYSSLRSTGLKEEALCQGLGTEELKRQLGIEVSRNDLKSKLFKGFTQAGVGWLSFHNGCNCKSESFQDSVGFQYSVPIADHISWMI